MLDYKFSSINEASGVTTVRLIIYEGLESTENESDPLTGSLVPVTRYRRTRIIAEEEHRLRGTNIPLLEIERYFNQLLSDKCVLIGQTPTPKQTDKTKTEVKSIGVTKIK